MLYLTTMKRAAVEQEFIMGARHMLSVMADRGKVCTNHDLKIYGHCAYHFAKPC